MENNEFNTVKKFAYGWFMFVFMIIIVSCGATGYVVFKVLSYLAAQ